MVDIVSLNYLPEAGGWQEQIPRLEDGWWPTGGAVDPANDSGLMNWQAQLLAQRTRFLKAAISGHVAIVGSSVPDKGLIWSSDGWLMTNATGGNVAPTGTTRIDLEANGFVEFAPQFAASILAEASPAGAIAAFGSSDPPNGWLECDGAQVSRGLYADLFAGIGTGFGNGDGATTFHLPDLRGEFLRGWDNGRGINAGRAFGSSELDQLQGHNHWTVTANTGGSSAQYLNTTTNGVGYIGTVLATDIAGDGVNGAPRVGTETRPRNVALMFCIKF